MSWWEDMYSMGGPSMGVFAMPETVAPEVSDFSLGGGIPEISSILDVDRSSGISVSGILGTIESTAKTGLDIFSKVYQLQDSVEAAKVARQMNQSRLDLQKAQASGAIEVALSRNQAGVAIEKIRAAAAVSNAQAQTDSAIQASTGGGFNLSKLIPFALIGFAVWKFAGAKK